MFHRKAKVRELYFITLNEDVGWFEVTMDDSSSLHVVVAIDDLVHQRNGLAFRQAPSTGDELGQITTITELGDDVGIIFGVIDVIDLKDVVAVLQRFQNIYLRVEEISMHVIVDFLHVYDFNGHDLILIKPCLPVTSLRPLKTWLE